MKDKDKKKQEEEELRKKAIREIKAILFLQQFNKMLKKI
jgi:hypothetical protein